MAKITVNTALLIALVKLVYSQFVFPFFGNQQQQYPYPQTSSHQANQNFRFFPQNFYPQQNFVFPTGGVSQPPPVNPHNHHQTSKTTRRTTYQQQYTQTTTTAQPFRVDGRISEIKCNEYAKLIRKKVAVVGSLSLDSSSQDISVNDCDPVTGLIVGGANANPNEFPHMAAIGYGDFRGEISFKCGGSLISELFVLTTAHCKQADRQSPTVVRLGDLNLRAKDKGLPEIDIPIASFISHEAYNKDTRDNDIAVIKMQRSAPFSKSIRPACVHQTELISKTKAVATGWGYKESHGGTTSDILQKVTLDIIDNQQCRNIYRDEENYNIFRSQICAGVLKGGKDTCGGDSGGPLQIGIGNECVFSIIGVTSYGSSYCGQKNSPGVYTRVSSHLDWIEKNVWG